jgi:membrane protein required for colicin V production
MKFASIDIFILAALGLAGFLGHRGGMTRKLFNLLMLLIAVVVGAKFMKPVGAFFSEPGIFSERTAVAVGFGLIFAAIFIPSLILYHKFGKTGLGKTSTSIIGVFLGMLEGALLLSFLFLALALFDMPDKETREDSLLYPPVSKFVPKSLELLKGYLPGARELRDEIARQLKDAEVQKSLSNPGTPL